MRSRGMGFTKNPYKTHTGIKKQHFSRHNKQR